eukprot:scaffold219355_cov36-Cyclotella_meneghiniana.AAC.2
MIVSGVLILLVGPLTTPLAATIKVRHHLQMIRNAAIASVNHHPPRMKVVAMAAVARDVLHVVVRASARKIGCNEIDLACVLSRMAAAMAR